jgi:hypothetical protein
MTAGGVTRQWLQNEYSLRTVGDVRGAAADVSQGCGQTRAADKPGQRTKIANERLAFLHCRSRDCRFRARGARRRRDYSGWAFANAADDLIQFLNWNSHSAAGSIFGLSNGCPNQFVGKSRCAVSKPSRRRPVIAKGVLGREIALLSLVPAACITNSTSERWFP